MKRSLFYIILLLQSSGVFGQTDSSVIKPGITYREVQEFLSHQKISKTDFNFSREQLYQWLRISNQKEPSAVLINNSSQIQVMPLQYDAKGLRWISPYYRFDYRKSEQYLNLTFGEQVVSDIISSAAGSILSKKRSRYHYNAVENRKPYSKPSFLQF